MLAGLSATKPSAPLNPDFPSGLPKLPEISDPTLLDEVFTHKSYFSRPVEAFLDSSRPRDYESLEHIGDSALNFCVTDIIRKEYPDLRPGGATIVRGKIINNVNLASVAVKYGFGPRMRVHATQEMVLREAGSIQADIFEAYVGALYTSQGFPPTLDWLTKLFTPYVHHSYAEALAEHNMSPSSTTNSNAQASNGALMKLNQLLQQSNFKPVKWDQKALKKSSNGDSNSFGDVNGKGPVTGWQMDAIVDGKHVGRGAAPSKARAKNLAAEAALKLLFDETASNEAGDNEMTS